MSPEGGEHALAQLHAVSDQACYEPGDAGDPASITSLVDRVVAAHGGIDILVSGGTPHDIGPTPFAEMTMEDLRGAFDSRIYPGSSRSARRSRRCASGAARWSCSPPTRPAIPRRVNPSWARSEPR